MPPETIFAADAPVLPAGLSFAQLADLAVAGLSLIPGVPAWLPPIAHELVLKLGPEGIAFIKSLLHTAPPKPALS